MGSYKKMYVKIMKTPTAKDIMPSELRSFLKSCGFVLKRVNGSHHMYGYPDYPKLLIIPMHDSQPVKPAYVDQVRQIISELEEKDG